MLALIARKTRSDAGDGEIAALYKERSEQAIELTQRRYGKYILKIAENILGDEFEAEECCNDVYLALWQNLEREEVSSFKAYLTRIARNIALDRLRRRTAQKQAQPDYDVALEELCECFESGQSTEEAYDERALRALLDRFVRSLDRRKRYVFISRYYLGKSIVEIANGWGAAESTVYDDLAKTREKLKAELMKEDYYREKGNA